MKTIHIFASFILAFGLLSGCSKQAPAPAAEAPSQTVIVETPAPAAMPAEAASEASSEVSSDAVPAVESAPADTAPAK